MLRLNRYVFLLLFGVILTSCASYQSKLSKSISDVKNNSYNNYDNTTLEKLSQGRNRLLYLEELGRLNFIVSNNKESIDYFSQVKSYYSYLDDQKISAANVTGNALASTILDDRSITYNGSDIERVIVNFYQSLNYLKAGDLDKSMVEVRATNDAVKLALSKREKRLNKEKSEQEQYTIQDPAALKEYNSNASSTEQGILNPYIYYISGQIRELYGDVNGAYVDYSQAFRLNPNNTYIKRDLKRLAQFYDINKFASIKEANYIDQNTYNKSNTLLVVYEQGFIPNKISIKVPIIWANSLVNIALPSYPVTNIFSNNVQISADGNFYPLEDIVNMLELFQYNLQEQYNAIILRQITRIISKYNLQYVASNDDQALNTTIRIMSLLSSLLEEADTRTFATLPYYVKVAKISSNSPWRKIALIINNKIIPLEVDVDNNSQLAIIYIIDSGDYIYQHLIYKTRNS